ncbi:hypothetical protein [Bacteroides thetaiotaomicron]|uniref:hypothetical protein n=1 Tax=Bacteroides thetaiotaomicron TaxID=818 RepID=UPI001F3DC017|nr:hypothetical protein [Bacteroides thetaiotaomicron]
MENIDVYVRCYYLEGADYLLSRKATTLVWDYLISNCCFCDSLDRLSRKMEFSASMSKQTPKELKVNVRFKEEGLAIELTLCTEENCTLKLEEFKIVFDDIKETPDVVKKGWIAKETILKEKNRVEDRRIKIRFLGVCSIIVILFAYLILFGYFGILCPILLGGGLVVILITTLIQSLPSCSYQPRKTELKAKLNIEYFKQKAS